MAEAKSRFTQRCACQALTLPDSGRIPYIAVDMRDEEHPCREVLFSMSFPAYQIGAIARAISDVACQLQIEGNVCPRGFKKEMPKEYRPKTPKPKNHS